MIHERALEAAQKAFFECKKSNDQWHEALRAAIEAYLMSVADGA